MQSPTTEHPKRRILLWSLREEKSVDNVGRGSKTLGECRCILRKLRHHELLPSPSGGSGRNRTPDKLPVPNGMRYSKMRCGVARSGGIASTGTGHRIGAFAENRARSVLGDVEVNNASHSSLMSPRANRMAGRGPEEFGCQKIDCPTGRSADERWVARVWQQFNSAKHQLEIYDHENRATVNNTVLDFINSERHRSRCHAARSWRKPLAPSFRGTKRASILIDPRVTPNQMERRTKRSFAREQLAQCRYT